MKLLCHSAVLASILSSSTTVAFTSPKSSLQLSPRASFVTELPSTLVKDADTINSQTTQELTKEQQQQTYIADASTEALSDQKSHLEISAASTEDVSEQKSYLDDGFVFGLEGSGLERPRGKVATVVVEGDGLETTPQQIGIVSATFAGHSLFAANAIHTLFSQTDGNIGATALISIATIISSWVAADFGSGVLHWSVDNYGNGRTPVMGNIIAAFQGHHASPWTITYRGFCNNVWKLCVPFGVPTVAAITLVAGPQHPMVSLFFSVFCFNEIMSQEFHKWSHMTKKEVPGWVNTLQDAGISLGRAPHAKHHIAPYDGNYCIVSGLCNNALDESGFFRWMEHRVYEMNGVESNSWKLDPKLRAKTLSGDYRLPQKGVSLPQ